jgi:hypothetical protein
MPPSGQKMIEISEPAAVSVTDLFKQADVVVVVQVVSGDSENYDTAAYKSKVLAGFKGAEQGQYLFFRPYVGYEVGSQYVVFLRRAKAGPKMGVQAAQALQLRSDRRLSPDNVPELQHRTDPLRMRF